MMSPSFWNYLTSHFHSQFRIYYNKHAPLAIMSLFKPTLKRPKQGFICSYVFFLNNTRQR